MRAIVLPVLPPKLLAQRHKMLLKPHAQPPPVPRAAVADSYGVWLQQ
jgi:hypothetical protein